MNMNKLYKGIAAITIATTLAGCGALGHLAGSIGGTVAVAAIDKKIDDNRKDKYENVQKFPQTTQFNTKQF